MNAQLAGQRQLPPPVLRSFSSRFPARPAQARILPTEPAPSTQGSELASRCVGLVQDALRADGVDAYYEAMLGSIVEFAILLDAYVVVAQPRSDAQPLVRLVEDVERWGGAERADAVEHALVMMDQAARLAPRLDREPAPAEAAQRDAELAQQYNAHQRIFAWHVTALTQVMAEPGTAPDVVEAVFADLREAAAAAATVVQLGLRLRHPDPDEP